MAANWRGRLNILLAETRFAGKSGLAMVELLRSNDAVLISFVEALLRDAGITHFVADQNMSILEGSIGAFPRRVLIDADREDEARQLMKDADLGAHLK
jgi:hypothetical protein